MAEAKASLLEAFDRGIPYYSAGVSWLLDGLTQFADDVAVAEKMKRVHRVALRLDVSQAFTVIRTSERAGDERLPDRHAAGPRGDCLWIEYGDAARPRRILIDGGRKLAWETLRSRFSALPPEQREFELLMLSHVDADHIEGLLAMLKAPDLPVSFKDVWFNGHRHLERVESLGAKQERSSPRASKPNGGTGTRLSTANRW